MIKRRASSRTWSMTSSLQLRGWTISSLIKMISWIPAKKPKNHPEHLPLSSQSQMKSSWNWEASASFRIWYNLTQFKMIRVTHLFASIRKPNLLRMLKTLLTCLIWEINVWRLEPKWINRVSFNNKIFINPIMIKCTNLLMWRSNQLLWIATSRSELSNSDSIETAESYLV